MTIQSAWVEPSTYNKITTSAGVELISQIKEHVAFMLSNDNARLILLLYQVDLSEKEIVRRERKKDREHKQYEEN